MGFDDFFEHDHKHHKHYKSHQYKGNDHQRSYSHDHHADIKLLLLQKLQNSPKLRALLIAAVIVIIALIIILLILFFPLLLMR